MCFIQIHTELLVQVDKPSIEGAVIGRCQCNSVCHVVATPRSSNWKDMSRIHKAQLNPGHCASVPIGKQDPATEIGIPAQATHFSNHALTLSWEHL
jgi:hypothetical protein